MRNYRALWWPSAAIEVLQKRAKIIADIRAFFTSRGYLEVETPILARFGVTDPYLNNIKADVQGERYYLQTSPEYHMKRLLAAGSGPIFQLSRVFRDGELGRWHNPEFTMLEWYQLDVDYHGLLAEVGQLLQEILNCPILHKKTYKQVFLEVCNIDPMHADLQELQDCLARFALINILPAGEQDSDQYLFLLMSHVVEPYLANEIHPVAIYDFPASQAQLAQVKNEVACRFEIYYQGIELANGFHELADVEIQQARFSADNTRRMERGLHEVAPDEYLLRALEHGLPDTSGVALGLDRLVALALKLPAVAKTLAFYFERA